MMDKYLSLKEKFEKREKILGTSMFLLKSTVILEYMNRDELDFILFDAEHGVFDTQNTVELFQTCRLLGMPCLLRVQDSKYHLISKALDIGADGIMLPRTESAGQLREAVDGLLFFPEGRKGCGGHGQLRRKEKFGDFAGTRYLLPQIESPKGIENLPGLLEEFGKYISAVIVGPYDLSVMVGTPLDIGSSAMTDAISRIFEVSARYGKSCGIFCDNAALARRYRGMGANVLWTSGDKDFFIRGFNDTMSELAIIK